ncbi:hypothetical protein M433DRAFT_8502 [Acidomyces richmondensis BFW]|nr:MAG: hypothetical protein FE78DRAFT_86112 [Acidomyces sp. 'richmondensis']KYG40765.1 hypothetical protein M433DRAFT_8502 [Acidomyces richmondensis BFW]
MAVHCNIVSIVIFTISIGLLLATFYSHKPHNARYIFVDLGANRADSLETFLGHKDVKFAYDFPHPEWAMHDEAEIYLFEANPYFNTALVEAKERYDALSIKITIFPSTVVDVEDGTRTFYLDNVNTDNDFWGSSTHASHPDAVASKSNGTELSAINISRWLLMNTLPRDFVVVKMDIEGAEYEVVPHMVEMGLWTVLDYLFVEWHPGVLNGDTSSEERVRVAQSQLMAGGVKMPSYDSAA